MAPLICPSSGDSTNLWIVGVPLASGVFTYTVRAHLSNGGNFDVDIIHTVDLKSGCPLITISPVTTEEMALTTSFFQQFEASDGVGPYVWDVASGSLPPGLSFSTSGLLSGTPTTIGTYTFGIRATDANACPGVRQYIVTVLLEPSPEDYWNDPEGGGGGSEDGPPRRILIVSPNVGTNYTRGKTVTIQSGTPLPRYPATNLVDDSADSVFRISERQFDLYVDLTTSRTPDVLALFNHNLDPTKLVSVYVGASPATLSLVGSFAAGRVNGWLDLRAFPARTGRYWRIKIATDNSTTITLGELVIGSAYILEGVLAENWGRGTKYFVERAFTDEFLPYKMHAGARQRQVQLSFIMDAASRAKIEAVFDDAGTTGNRVVVIPDTGKNDPYFIDWPARRAIGFPQSDRQTKIDLLLTEQSMGVV